LFGYSKYRVLFAFWRRPVLPFAVQFVILGPLILADQPDRAAAGYVFALPWLLPVMAVVNLPLFAGALRAFRMDLATKRNHALEHATILQLERRSGKRFSGRATARGFRISGPASHDEVRAAFDDVSSSVRAGVPLVYVSPRCGSNIVTALGLALGLLLAVAVGGVILRPSLPARVVGLVVVLTVFLALRHGLGNAIQRRFFMAVDFTDVSLRRVRGVPPGLLDRGPVAFVETRVRAERRAV
jgi:hypothetical protein